MQQLCRNETVMKKKLIESRVVIFFYFYCASMGASIDFVSSRDFEIEI